MCKADWSLGSEFLAYCRILEVNFETLRNRNSYVPVTPGLELSVMRGNATESNWNQRCDSEYFFFSLFTPFVISLTHVFCLFLFYLLNIFFFILSPHPFHFFFLHLPSVSLLAYWNLCSLLCIFILFFQTIKEHKEVFFIGWITLKLEQMMLVKMCLVS